MYCGAKAEVLFHPLLLPKSWKLRLEGLNGSSCLMAQVHHHLLSTSVTSSPLPNAKTKAPKTKMSKKPVNTAVADVQAERLQVGYLAYHLVYYILNEEGIKMNGFATGKGHPPPDKPGLQDTEYLDALKTMERMMTHMRLRHRAEMLEHVKSLDISDSQLYGSFQRVALETVKEGIHWGRIVALIAFTGMLAVRLHKTGQQHKIEGLIGWLTAFLLNDQVTHWVKDHGGWVRMLPIVCCIV